MKLFVVAACCAMLSFTLIAKPQFLSAADYQQAKQSFQLKGAFPELIVLDADQQKVLHCDTQQHAADGCFDKVREMAQQSGYTISLYTLDAPFCQACLNWNAQLQQLTAQASVSIIYVGN